MRAVLLLEFERSTKKRIVPGSRFYVHNFGRPRTRSDLPAHSCGHLQTPLSSRILAKCMQQICYLPYCTTVYKCYMHLFVFSFVYFNKLNNYLARSANLPTGLYILPIFFLYFFLFFNGRLRNSCMSEANGPIFTKISGLVDGCKGLFTLLSFF